jgi:hypothetical protein
VQPPFVAAPIEGRNARRWLGVGLAGAVLAMCCGMGVVAVGGLVIAAIPALNERAQAAVGDYLDALVAGDWEQAYELRCEEDQQAESLAEFTRRVSEPPRIESYELGEINLMDPQGEQLELPVDLVYDDGRQERETYPLVGEQDTGTLEVCEQAG